MDQDRWMYEVDMERWYEDDSWLLDEINAELQQIAEQQQASKVG